MATYAYQCAYTPEAWAKMSKNPQDRIAAVTPVVEAAGGKVVGGWFCFGEYDVVAIFEMPDNTSMASVAVAVAFAPAAPSRRPRRHRCSHRPRRWRSWPARGS